MDTIRYVLAVLVWATFPPTVVFWLLIHGFIGPWRRAGGPAQTYLVVVPTCLLLFGILLRWNPVEGYDLGMNWSIFAAGFAIWMASWALERHVRRAMDFRTIAGVPELAWQAKDLPRLPTMDEFIGDDGDRSTATSAAEKAETDDPFAPLPPPPAPESDPSKLVRTGPYSRLRHPRAVATVVGLWGWAMMSNYGTSYLVAALFVPAMALAIRLEERELAERFGSAWSRYSAEVPAVLPRRS